MIERDAVSQEYPQTLKLLTRGRKSGLPHIAIVRFVLSNGVYYVVAGKRRSDWALNAIVSGEATIRIGDYSQQVKCEVFSDREEVLTLFAQRYGRRTVADWYADSEVCLRLSTNRSADNPRKNPRRERICFRFRVLEGEGGGLLFSSVRSL